MTYTPVTWTASTKLTAKAFNHLETIYTQACETFIDNHNHDTRYYTKSATDVKFFNTTYMGNGSKADADLLDGHHASEILGEGVPMYGIVWWNDAMGDLPTGWYVCDGNNGTTDYRDHFICGAGSSYTVKNHYGSNNVTPSASVGIGTHSLTESEIPAHTHSTSDSYEGSPYDNNGGGSNSEVVNSISYPTRNFVATGGGAAHGHAGSTVSYNSESNVPPYVILYLIQRRA